MLLKYTLALSVFLFFGCRAEAQIITSDGTAVFYYDSGEKRSEGKLINGKRQGAWQFYSHGGKLIGLQEYKHGVLHGRYAIYDSLTGNPVMEGEYCNGQGCGTWKEYFGTTGKLSTVGGARKGLKHGAAVYYYEDGTVMSEGAYDNDKERGEWKFYLPNGKLTFLKTYKNGKLHGKIVHYDRHHGTVVANGMNRNGKREGEWQFYFAHSGELKAIETYKDSLWHGSIRAFDSVSGHKYSDGTFRNGKPHGKWYTFYRETGHPRSVQLYENGKEQWEKEYNPKGDLIKDAVHGERGRLNLYDSATGKPIMEAALRYGLRHGSFKLYHPVTGKLTSSCEYVNGLRQGEMRLYDSLGRLYSIRQFMQDSLHGEMITIDHGTKIAIKNTMNNGVLHGEFVATYWGGVVKEQGKGQDFRQGAVLMQGLFAHGRKEGEWRGFDTLHRLLLVQNFKAGMLHGSMVQHDPEFNTTTRYTYYEGVKEGSYSMARSGNVKWMEGNYVADSLDGIFLVYYPSGEMKRRTMMERGAVLWDSCFAEDGTSEALYPLVEQAHYNGDLMTYIGDNLRYPEAAKDEGKEGAVRVQFAVHSSGMVSDVKVVESMGALFDAEAVRLISQMPPWQPQRMDGVPMKTWETVPVYFWKRD